MPSSDDPSTTQPLLPSTRVYNDDDAQPQYQETYCSTRRRVQKFLSSRTQHYTVLGLVACDLLGIFADIIINLYQCDQGEGGTSTVWDDVRDGLGIAGLVFSCLFMLELMLSVWAFGWQ
jgi:hypothetical protein